MLPSEFALWNSCTFNSFLIMAIDYQIWIKVNSLISPVGHIQAHTTFLEPSPTNFMWSTCKSKEATYVALTITEKLVILLKHV